ncbi:MAG: glycosyltransferase family 4 protein [Bacteroidota bacterium]
MPLKILQVCSKPIWPPKDGGVKAMLSMTRGFAKAGHDVHVLMMNTAKHRIQLRNLPQDLQLMASFYAVDVPTQIRIGDILANFIFSAEKSYHIQRFTSKAFRQELERLLTKEGFDVVLLESLFTTQYSDSIRAHSDAILAYRAHNIEHEIWSRRAETENNPIKKYVFNETAHRLKTYENNTFAAQPFDVIVPITGKDSGQIKKMGATIPLKVIPFSIDLEEIDDSEVATEHPSVFFIGSMDWIPNQEGVDWFLSQVWPGIHKRYPDVRFYLAGRNMPQKYKSNERLKIEVVGEVDSAADFIKSKSIMVAPLLSGSGMRVKIIDGMTYGKPTVATSVSAEGLGIRDGEHLMKTDDPDEFIERVGMLIEHQGVYDIMSQKAKKFIYDKFDRNKQIADLVSFFEDQMKKKKEK